MKNTEEAFKWIVNILNKHKIPFQIAGGFAARVYGSKRELADIDFDIPEDRFSEIIPEVKKYIIFGPKRYIDRNWDLQLMTLVYKNQEIDIGGSNNVMIFNSNNKQWLSLKTDFMKTDMIEIYGIRVPIIVKEELIKYKKILSREVDKIDIKQISKI